MKIHSIIHWFKQRKRKLDELSFIKDLPWVDYIMIFYFSAFITEYLLTFFKKPDLPPVGIFALLLTYVAFRKAVSFIEMDGLFKISDRCLTIGLATEINGNGNKLSEKNWIVYPDFINDGGDAFAYEILVGRYRKSSGVLKNNIKNQLLRIYENTGSAQPYFKQFGEVRIRREPDSQWEPKLEYEAHDQFNIITIISQLNHRTYWQTRATCLSFIKNDLDKNYIKNLSKNNLELLKAYKNNDIGWEEKLFDNLMRAIEHDSSLIVRVIAFSIYLRLAKVGAGEFIKDHIYCFAAIIKHWGEHRLDIIKQFKIDMETHT